MSFLEKDDIASSTVLGSGVYGTVYKVSFKTSIANNVVPNKEYALKKFSKFGSNKATIGLDNVVDVLREMTILFGSDHPNIMKGVSVFMERDKNNYTPSILMDLAIGELDTDDYRFKTWNVAAQLILGLNYLHTNGVAHMDLKPNNILMFKDETHDKMYIPKLTDFGISEFLRDRNATNNRLKGVRGYVAPSKVKTLGRYADFGMADDVYTLGIIIFQLLADGSIHDNQWNIKFKPVTQKDIHDNINTSLFRATPAQKEKYKKGISKFLYNNFFKEGLKLNNLWLWNVIKGKEFKKLCSKYAPTLDISTDYRPFKCLVPYKLDNDIINKESRSRMIDEILKMDAHKSTQKIVFILGIDLYDRYRSATKRNLNIEYMKVCISIINTLFVDFYKETLEVPVGIFLNILKDVEFTLYRPLMTYLCATVSEDKLFEMIYQEQINDIINEGCVE